MRAAGKYSLVLRLERARRAVQNGTCCVFVLLVVQICQTVARCSRSPFLRHFRTGSILGFLLRRFGNVILENELFTFYKFQISETSRIQDIHRIYSWPQDLSWNVPVALLFLRLAPFLRPELRLLPSSTSHPLRALLVPFFLV